jgi:transcriptional/translational regulatory protein YebC/TACO1
MEVALDSGASDMSVEGDVFEVVTPANDLEAVRSAIEGKSIPMVTAEISMVPQNTVKLNEKQAESMLKLYEALEEHDDVQNVYANFDIDDETMNRLAG